jgi:hypothetical protein
VSVLSSGLRKVLERSVVLGRGVAEGGAGAALTRLGVVLRDAPSYLTADERSSRVKLRARARQLGDPLDTAAGDNADVSVRCPLLTAEVAYEQWHRFLFARFLEVNDLLRHPEFEMPLSLAQCAELAGELGELDGWSVAARIAQGILPGIFRPEDPSVAVRLAREDLLALERAVTELPAGIFEAEDSLGWVYQFWQSKAKDAVNASGRKVGGADLSPVTQLFTEDYMVRFLLENSLGAWWAGKYPESPLLAGYEFLRFDENGHPASGTFEGWPDLISDVTVMDPCCGSGHFLVAAFGMLWRMRAEAERLSPADAQDAVLRDNLFGLELDPRCTQIAMFALALEAWKQGGFRVLPTPQVACSGIPAKVPLQEWTKLADGDYQLETALARLHALFADADTLGSLIDPVRAAEHAGLESVDWHDIAPLLQEALTAEVERSVDPASAVFGDAAAGIARAADYLSRKYTLIVTNVPYLTRLRQSATLAQWADLECAVAKNDLATMCLWRFRGMIKIGGVVAAVSPQHWLYLGSYRHMRKYMLDSFRWHSLARLGSGAFGQIGGEVVNVSLGIWSAARQVLSNSFFVLDAESSKTVDLKMEFLRASPLATVAQHTQRDNPDMRIMTSSESGGKLLAEYAGGYAGVQSGDYPRFGRYCWEIAAITDGWERQQSTSQQTRLFGGCERVFKWDAGKGDFYKFVVERLGINGTGAWIRGTHLLGKRGVTIKLMGDLPATLFLGTLLDNNVGVIAPKNQNDLPAVWAFVSSDEYRARVRNIDRKMNVTNATLVKVPFDVERWRNVAAEQYPNGLPEPWSDDATQWLFRGLPAEARQPLQVAVARLVGFRWPDQEPDAVDAHVDSDGIVCLPAVGGEQPAAERVRAVLAASYGDAWSTSKLDELLEAAGGKQGDLEGWLNTVFFKDHCKVFGNRPFVWHIWDGLRDGFSVLVNYHRLDRVTLERLTYTTLGWWLGRQKADADAGVAGAEARFVAATDLREKLELILEGEPPFDVYVRWKSLAEQPLGWDPDLDDGVRLNIRPFVEAGVLRSKLAVQWKKDRGTNPDGTERHNDLHLIIAEKRKARGLS